MIAFLEWNPAFTEWTLTHCSNSIPKMTKNCKTICNSDIQALLGKQSQICLHLLALSVTPPLILNLSRTIWKYSLILYINSCRPFTTGTGRMRNVCFPLILNTSPKPEMQTLQDRCWSIAGELVLIPLSLNHHLKHFTHPSYFHLQVLRTWTFLL